MEKLNQTFIDLLPILSEINNLYRMAAVKLNLSESEMNIFYVLSQMSVSQKFICDFTGISKQTINAAVKKLIEKKLISPLKGTRNEKLLLTAEGKIIAEEKTGKLIKLENRILSNWTEKEKKHYVALNQKYLKELTEELKNL